MPCENQGVTRGECNDGVWGWGGHGGEREREGGGKILVP
jgi:hypothetical protein